MTRVERIGDAVLYLGDCREILSDLGDYQCVVTDPPFGINYRSGHATRDLWAADSITGDLDVVARDEVFLQIASTRAVPVLSFGSWKARRPLGTRAVLIWDKGPALGMGALDIPWKPSAEEIYVIGKGWVGSRDEGAVLYCPPVQSMACNGRVHPNQKPIALLERLLRKCPAGTCLDPFMGSASVGVACARLGRKFIGIEIDENYFNIAVRRITDAYRQADLFVKAPVAEAPADARTRDLFKDPVA